MNSLVSICIPTYNGEKYLNEALEPVKSQVYKNIEVIISDDNSTDSTLEICNKFKHEVDFPVYIYSHKPSGIGANWNYTIEKANGDFIKFLFQDDVLMPDCIEKFIKHNEETGQKIIFYKRFLIGLDGEIVTNCKWFNTINDLQKVIDLNFKKEYLFQKKDFIPLGSLYPEEIETNFLGEPIASFIHKDVFEKVGKFDENLKQLLDTQYWLRILQHYDILILEYKLIQFRIHPEQTSFINLGSKIDERKEIQNYIYKNYYKYLNRRVKNTYWFKKYPILLQLRNWKYKFLS